MLEEMEDEDINELCRIIGNLKLSEELITETLTEASERESDLLDLFREGESS